MRLTIDELYKISTFKGRYEYLKIGAKVGATTFGINRHINQTFYTSQPWRSVRNQVIIRDGGCDLGVPGYKIIKPLVILIHHINPITEEDIINNAPNIYDINNLITTTHNTHNAIHYGDVDLLPTLPNIRYKNDTCPWK